MKRAVFISSCWFCFRFIAAMNILLCFDEDRSVGLTYNDSSFRKKEIDFGAFMQGEAGRMGLQSEVRRPTFM